MPRGGTLCPVRGGAAEFAGPVGRFCRPVRKKPAGRTEVRPALRAYDRKSDSSVEDD
jgi:hypothetical protein